jgi:hypothetical protein
MRSAAAAPRSTPNLRRFTFFSIAWNWSADAHPHGKERQFQYKRPQSASAYQRYVAKGGSRRAIQRTTQYLLAKNVSQIAAIADLFDLLLCAS